MKFKIIENHICAPQGFLASGINAGIRKNPNKPDLAIIYSKIPAISAGVFTTNQVKAAPVLLTQQHIKKNKLQAIVVNSGNANACTGKQGKLHALQMASATAKQLQIDTNKVGVASTGVIGVPLPIKKIVQGISMAANTLTTQSDLAAKAIMTTDLVPKSDSSNGVTIRSLKSQ